MGRKISLSAKACCAALVCWIAATGAEIRLPAVFSDNMVLQRGQPLPVWGWAQRGETVTVAIAGTAVVARANEHGRWQLRLPAIEPQDHPLEMVVTGISSGTVRIKNVLVGEVWLCCGPSNIFWPVKRCDRAKQEIASASFPQIRFFTVARGKADRPQADCEGKWIQCSPTSVGDWSAVGFFFARELTTELKVLVGVLQSFWGGSRIEAWTSLEALQTRPGLKPILDYWAERLTKPAAAELAQYEKDVAQWRAAADQAKAKGAKSPKQPKKPDDPADSAHRPACLYNAMVAPLVPFAIRGAINYQGLGNLFWAEHSRLLLETMIGDWRRRWGQGDFPFGMVQPAPYTCQGWAQSSPDAYAIQRESQLLVLQKVPNTGLALTMDIDAVDVLHFPAKQPVAHRLACWALSTVYGRTAAYQGPIYQSLAIEGDRIRVRFAHAEGGLMTSDNRPPTCFTVSGPDKVFHPAEAFIEGSTVIVRSAKVPQPVAVRFAWQNTDVPNLVNRDGLPASLFRSLPPR